LKIYFFILITIKVILILFLFIMRHTTLPPRASKILLNYLRLSAGIGVIGGLSTPFVLTNRRDIPPLDLALLGIIAVSTYATFWPLILIHQIKQK